MSDPGIFIFGFVVFAIVGAACWLIGFGLITERRDREVTDAQAEAANAYELTSATAESGRTQATGPGPKA